MAEEITLTLNGSGVEYGRSGKTVMLKMTDAEYERYIEFTNKPGYDHEFVVRLKQTL